MICRFIVLNYFIHKIFIFNLIINFYFLNLSNEKLLIYLFQSVIFEIVYRIGLCKNKEKSRKNSITKNTL